MVVLVDLHADALHRREHLGAQVLSRVGRVDREVATLDARTMAHVAHFVLGVRVPRGVGGIDLEPDGIHRVGIPHVVEQEEFGFGSHIGHVADTRRNQIGFGLLGGAARVTVIGFAGVRLHHGAVNADRLLRIERIDISALHVQHQLHVGSFDRLPARNR